MKSINKKHNNSVFGDKIKCPTVLDWYPSDTRKRFESQPKEHQDYWHEQPPLRYKLNTYGFRSDEFPEKEYRESITFLGCSQTFGTGLHKESTWASLVAKHYNLLEINLAIASGSLDSAFRVYNEWQPIHKSKITCLLLPPCNRMEVARDAIWNPNITQWESIGHWSLTSSRYGMELKPFIMDLLSDINQEVRTDRNLAAIKYMAQETESTFTVSSFEGQYDKARDNLHAGPEWNKNMANKFIKAIGIL